MDQRDSNCPFVPPSETAAKGTDFVRKAGKEDPFEVESRFILLNI